MRLTDYPLIVIMWTQEGCAHCEETLPRWRAVAERYAQCLPSVRLEVGEYAAAADLHRIKMLPTVMTMRNGRGGLRRLEGEQDAAAIEHFYALAAMGLDCQLG